MSFFMTSGHLFLYLPLHGVQFSRPHTIIHGQWISSILETCPNCLSLLISTLWKIFILHLSLLLMSSFLIRFRLVTPAICFMQLISKTLHILLNFKCEGPCFGVVLLVISYVSSCVPRPETWPQRRRPRDRDLDPRSSSRSAWIWLSNLNTTWAT